MAKISDPLDKHDWNSQGYVVRWAERQEEREADRREPFRLMAETIRYDKEAPIKILDLGAGYGALTQFLLRQFPNATAVCQDGSKEMADLGRERMEHLGGRFSYALCDFGQRGWSKTLKEKFEAVVSAIAIHNVREAEIIQGIYQELFALVKPGGCFLNFDRMSLPLEKQMAWLREAGFENVKCFWNDGGRALFGGFVKQDDEGYL